MTDLHSTTRHVIEAIDGALADSEFPDAMRWSPEPETVTDAPAPFDGNLVWQPPQRYEPHAAAAALRDRVRELLDANPPLSRPVGHPAAIWAAPAGTEPPVIFGETHEWTAIGHLTDDAVIGFDLPDDDVVIASPNLTPRTLTFSVGPVPALEAQAARFAAAAGLDHERAAAWLQDMIASLTSAMTATARLAEAPPPDDVRERALRMRQQRNTGPSRPPRNRARRPRLHQ